MMAVVGSDAWTTSEARLVFRATKHPKHQANATVLLEILRAVRPRWQRELECVFHPWHDSMIFRPRGRHRWSSFLHGVGAPFGRDGYPALIRVDASKSTTTSPAVRVSAHVADPLFALLFVWQRQRRRRAVPTPLTAQGADSVAVLEQFLAWLAADAPPGVAAPLAGIHRRSPHAPSSR
jgi:hypothetical protein